MPSIARPHPTANWATGLPPADVTAVQRCARAIVAGNRRLALDLAAGLDAAVPPAARSAHAADLHEGENRDRLLAVAESIEAQS